MLALIAGCSSQSSSSDAARSEAGADLATGDDTAGGTDASDGPVCVYQNYPEAELGSIADGGTYPNLPCGGCAPDTSSGCSPDGVNSGHRYVCWAQYLYPLPPAPGRACSAIGVKVDGVDPTVWDVCCF